MHNFLCTNCPHPTSAAAAWWAHHHQTNQQHHSPQYSQEQRPLSQQQLLHPSHQHPNCGYHHQTNHLRDNEFDNPHSESATAAEVSPEQLVTGGAQPSTPRTPSSPPDHSQGTNTPNPPTPGNTSTNSMVNSPSQYVTITGFYRNNILVDGEGGSGTEGLNNSSSYVTYVDGLTEHSNVYAAASNGHNMSYPVYPMGNSSGIYNTPPSASQYYSHPASASTYPQEPGGYNATPTLGGSNNIGNADVDSLPNMTHATRVSPATVQWLLENYETAEGVSLPRYTMYYHYLRHCSNHKLDSVNAASFGKLIRSVFLGLRTRRLGTRGNSKYHYYGIRLKPNSSLNHIFDDGTPISGPNGYYTMNGRGTGLVLTPTPQGNGHNENNKHCRTTSNNNNNNNHTGKRLKNSKGEAYDTTHMNGLQIHDPSASQYLGDPAGVLSDFPELNENVELPDGISLGDIVVFRNLYKEHCESLLDALINFQMTSVESYWRSFWRADENCNTSPQAPMEAQNYEKLLPKNKLILLCTFKKVQDFIRDADFHFYQNLVGFLLPNVLRPIPSAMTHAIRNFAKALEGWLTSAMSGFPQEIIRLKVSIVNSLSQTLRRYTSLNHLAQAARAVLQNQNQISQMLTDLNRVDFNNVEEQASWVCGCDSRLVSSLEQDFKETLAQQRTLEQWAAWLENTVDKLLDPYLKSPNFVNLCRQFLMKWSYYSSLIIRDLTLRSATSFGSFHLLRLLYDEYMFYLVEHRVAQVTGIVPIAVIGKFDTLTNKSHPSTVELMETFTQPVDVSEEVTMTSSQIAPNNSHRSAIVGIPVITSVGRSNNQINDSSFDGSASSLIQTSTTVIASQHTQQHSDHNSYHTISPTSIKKDPN